MFKDKLVNFGKMLQANKDAIIQKGLVAVGVAIAVVIVAAISGNEEITANTMTSSEGLVETEEPAAEAQA